jgi:hypothetical protein
VYTNIPNSVFLVFINMLERPSQSIARHRSRYEADLSVFVVSLISSSMGYMGSTKSPNLELWISFIFVDAERLRALTYSMLIDLSIIC